VAPRFGDSVAAAIEAAERWAIFDPDPVTRGQVDSLVDAGDPRLVKMFAGRIAFGTAGLRAAVGPGPLAMNALVVRQTTVGVVRWLQAGGIAEPRVLVGFDARHDSQRFADHVAAAIGACGGTALVADAAAPTPVFAHALLAEEADAAVVVTASHNPPADNGYKLYLGDGLQLVAPADEEIAAMIEDVAGRWHDIGPAIDDELAELDGGQLSSAQAWIDAHAVSAADATFTTNRDVTIAATAMHGVGGLPLVQAFRTAGFPEPLIVEDQFEPDGDFPTVPFPNPEEPGAMDMVIALAEAEATDGAFANDPDADRLAIAVPARSGSGMVALSGNELGALLADHVLRHTAGPDRLVARSVVSSRLLEAMAADAGVHCDVTLTGFKWVARPIVTRPETRFVFGFEEAIGYCVGNRVRDKDGISAAVVAAEMLATFKADGVTAWDRLDQLAAVHGVYVNHPINVRFEANPDRVASLMQEIAADPPSILGDEDVTQSGPVGLGLLPNTSGIHLVTNANTQVIVRPSGTEPKIKAYIEVIEPVAGAVDQARRQARARLAAIAADVTLLLGESSVGPGSPQT